MRYGSVVDQRDAGSRGHGPPPLGVGAIGELAAGRDEQIGKIFRNMRAALKLPRDALARRLATTTGVIDSFEAGALTALPNWKETDRIVRSYCDLLRFDPEPVLWRLRSQLEAVANYARPAPAPARLQPNTHRTGPSTVTAQSEPSRAKPARRRRRKRAVFALSTPVVLVAALALAGQSAAKPVYEAIGFLPKPIAGPVRAGFDYLVGFTAVPGRDGLTWVEVGDPRTRKADRLPARAH